VEITSAGLMIVVVPVDVVAEGTPEITRDAGSTVISSMPRVIPTVSRASTIARSL
jgi:hypothetical protein